MTDHAAHHDRHHSFIKERVTAYRAAPKARKYRSRRNQAFITGYTTFVGHLRCCHGWNRFTGLPLPFEELERIHENAHADD